VRGARSGRRRCSSTATAASATSTGRCSRGYDYRPLRIGDDVMVSTKCTIIADLGDRAFVGANSVVVKPVPEFCLAAGVPAAVRDYFGPSGREPEEIVAT
jgi:acetyltransferase-like isoleucine patch superfamily enzyme